VGLHSHRNYSFWFILRIKNKTHYDNGISMSDCEEEMGNE